MKRPVGIVGLCLLCLGAFSAEGFAKGRKVPPDRALRRKVAHHAVSASLGAALADLANEAGVTIRVDWKGLEKVGVTAKTRVAVDLEKVTWRQVLEVMLSRVSRRGHPLGWQIHSGDILVSTHRRILLLEAGTQAEIAKAAGKTATARRAPSGPALRRKILPGVSFDKLPFRDALRFFQTVTGSNFHVNWRALEQEGIDPQTPISLNLRRISVARALDLVLDQVNADREKLTSVYWVVDRGVLLVSTGNALNRRVVTRVIDAGTVLLIQPDVAGPRIDLESASERDMSGRGASSGSRGFWDDDSDEREREGESYNEQKKKHHEKVVNTIMNMIGRDMWEPEGKGSIRVLNNKLVISQTLLGFKMLEQSLR